MTRWTENDIPNQDGRIVIVTGANSGLGLQTSLVLAGKGAQVIMACRNVKKAEDARWEILRQFPQAKLELMALDVGDLSSVREFAQEFKAKYDRLDVLYNNAGLMAVPYAQTADGFETQFGVNHLGHFALTGLLIERMVHVPHSRVVTLSSTAAWYEKINFDDLQARQSYSRYGAYGQSKLANLLFARELQRRLAAAHAQTISVTAHPGLVITGLQHRASHESQRPVEWFIYSILGRTLAQQVEMGTLPQLYAGTASGVEGGAFYGPEFLHTRGYPKRVDGPNSGYDLAAAERLWEVSEQLTGVTYDALAAQPVH